MNYIKKTQQNGCMPVSTLHGKYETNIGMHFLILARMVYKNSSVYKTIERAVSGKKQFSSQKHSHGNVSEGKISTLAPQVLLFSSISPVSQETGIS